MILLKRALEDLVNSAIVVSGKPGKYKELLSDSASNVKRPPRGGDVLKPGVIILPSASCFVFIGDLHGDLMATRSVLRTVWSDLLDDCIVVFLGDYIDRGDYQLETLALVLSLKSSFPDRVVLLRGNHEPPEWLIPYPHDYPYLLESRFGPEWRDIYAVSLSLFENLPLAAILEGFFIALHGGPPRRVLVSNTWQEALEVGSEKFSDTVLADILWSDPIESDSEYMDSPRGAGVLFGRKITEKMLSLIRGSYIIRGHEAVNGVETHHGERVFTVFTASTVYGLSNAGVLKLTLSKTGEKYTPHVLNVKPSA
ncbi:MAG: serine/threonine protein phosphatase [Desulfurococcaceae archaeon]|nr:serine/threonine protein phosphatase [Desulfurococcaceae archaeon]